jgi:hypothetical protein
MTLILTEISSMLLPYRWILSYLAKLYQLHRLLSNELYKRMTTFVKIETTGEEVAMAYFKVLSQRCPGGT